MAEVSTLSLIQGGLVLSCSLIWAGVVKSGVQYIYPNDQGGEFRSQLMFAIVLTVVVIIILHSIQQTNEIANYVKNKVPIIPELLSEPTDREYELNLYR